MLRGPVLVLLLAGLAGTTPAEELFRCGSWVISRDLSVAELRAKCGEPTSKTVSTEDVYAHGQHGTFKAGTTTIEHWVYQRGSGSFSMVVTITDGVITDIERGP